MQHTQHTHLAALIIYDPLDDFGKINRGGNGAIGEMGEELRWAGFGVLEGGGKKSWVSRRLKCEDDHENANGRRERMKERKVDYRLSIADRKRSQFEVAENPCKTEKRIFF